MLTRVLSFSTCYVLVLLLVQLAWQVLVALVKHFYLWKHRKRFPAPAAASPSISLSVDTAAQALPNNKVSNNSNTKRITGGTGDTDGDNGNSNGPGDRTAMGIPFIRFAGDNSPKKRIIAHDLYRSYTLYFVAGLLTFSYINGNSVLSFVMHAFLVQDFVTPHGTATHVDRHLIYSESGIGLNFYYKGYRLLGIDYHAWQIRQDPQTGKPLHPSQQFVGPARPHLDIPPWNLHHWPYESFDDSQKLESLMSQKSAERAEKKARKEQKRARREENLRQKRDVQAVKEMGVASVLKDDTNIGEIADLTDISLLTFEKKDM